jgi:hypothetical protein
LGAGVVVVAVVVGGGVDGGVFWDYNPSLPSWGLGLVTAT